MSTTFTASLAVIITGGGDFALENFEINHVWLFLQRCKLIFATVLLPHFFIFIFIYLYFGRGGETPDFFIKNTFSEDVKSVKKW